MGFMFPLDSETSKQNGFDIDLEIGASSIIGEKERRSSDVYSIGNAGNHQQVMSLPKDLSRVDDRSFENGKSICFLGEGKMSLLESKTGKEWLKEKSLRKPSKPPKPPKSLSIDAAEQKKLREMSELAIQKRLRIERMKSLRNRKNANAGFNSNNFCALFVTFLFCVIIIWHGITSKGSSVVKAHGYPEQPLLHYGEFHKKTKRRRKHSFSRSRFG